jgi:hypothetical protein
MRQRTAAEMAAEIALRLQQKLGVRGVDLETRLAHAGRRLPRRVRRLAAEIVDAEKREANPRLARQSDPAALARAFAEVERHLAALDRGARRRDAILGVLGSISFALLVVAGGLIAWLRWRGFL